MSANVADEVLKNIASLLLYTAADPSGAAPTSYDTRDLLTEKTEKTEKTDLRR